MKKRHNTHKDNPQLPGVCLKCDLAHNWPAGVRGSVHTPFEPLELPVHTIVTTGDFFVR